MEENEISVAIKDAINYSVFNADWDVMTKSEAKRYIKNGLIERALDTTPYVKTLIGESSRKCKFVLNPTFYMKKLSDDPSALLVCNPIIDKSEKVQSIKMEKIPSSDRYTIGIIPVMRFIKSKMSYDFVVGSELDKKINERIVKTGRYIYEFLDKEKSSELEDAYYESAINYVNPSVIWTGARFGSYEDYEEYIYKKEYYARNVNNDRWVKIKPIEWIMDWENKLLICKNVIDIIGTESTFEDKLFNVILQQALQKEKKVSDKKEYKIIEQDNVMSQIIRNKYSLNSDKAVERTLK